MPSFFITATDTDAGKTYISSMLLHVASLHNQKTLGFKPVASGMEVLAGKNTNQDVELLKAASTISIPHSAVNPYLFEQAIAPHIAAVIEHQHIDLNVIKKQVDSYQHQADFVLVEGVGGWEVPLNDTQGIPDLAKILAYPVIVVVKIKTGCINHAILTINAIRQQGLEIAGWVANQVKDNDVARANISSIEDRTGLSCLAKIAESEPLSFLQQLDFLKNKGEPAKEIMQLYKRLLELN
ncbi:MAG: dethiobiotin synthase [Pseudomonadota bacterium]